MEVKKTAGIARFKSLAALAIFGANLLIEWPVDSLGIPWVAYPILFAFPILTISLAVSTWPHFRTPEWAEQPFLNPNRLAIAQFAAVVMLAIAVSTAIGALARGNSLPDICFAAACVGGGYALSIPLGLRLKAKREADERKA